MAEVLERFRPVSSHLAVTWAEISWGSGPTAQVLRPRIARRRGSVPLIRICEELNRCSEATRDQNHPSSPLNAERATRGPALPARSPTGKSAVTPSVLDSGAERMGKDWPCQRRSLPFKN